MTKFFVALLVVSLLAFVSASDDDDDSGPSSLFGSDDGGGFFDLLKPISSFGADFAKNFKPPPGGHGSAHSFSSHHEEKTVNGKKVEDESKLDQVDNVDGSVVNEVHKST